MYQGYYKYTMYMYIHLYEYIICLNCAHTANTLMPNISSHISIENTRPVVK